VKQLGALEDILEAKAKILVQGYNPDLVVVSPKIYVEILHSAPYSVMELDYGSVPQIFGMKVKIDPKLQDSCICMNSEFEISVEVQHFNPSRR